MAKRKKGFQKKCLKKKLDGKIFSGNFEQEIPSEGFISHFMIKFSRSPFSIHITIDHIVDYEESKTDEKYDYSERRLFYDVYFDALKCSGYLTKEDLEDIKYLCQN